MYRGVKSGEIYPYILEAERESPNPTVWWIRPQTVREGNVPIAGYVRAHQIRNKEEAAAQTTKADRSQFLRVIDHVDNVCVGDEEAVNVSGKDTLLRLFEELDISTFNELMNASRDIFSLKEAQKKDLSSSSGRESRGKSPAASDTTASTVEK
jgi:hypothetical protein